MRRINRSPYDFSTLLSEGPTGVNALGKIKQRGQNVMSNISQNVTPIIEYFNNTRSKTAPIQSTPQQPVTAPSVPYGMALSQPQPQPQQQPSILPPTAPTQVPAFTQPGASLADLLGRGIPIDPQKVNTGRTLKTLDISGRTGSPGRTTVATPDPNAVVEALNQQEQQKQDEEFSAAMRAIIGLDANPIQGPNTDAGRMLQSLNDPMPAAPELDLTPGDTQMPGKMNNFLDILGSPEVIRALAQFGSAIGGEGSVGQMLGDPTVAQANSQIEQNVLSRMLGGEQFQDIRGRGTALGEGGLENVMGQFMAQQEMARRKSETESMNQVRTTQIPGIEAETAGKVLENEAAAIQGKFTEQRTQADLDRDVAMTEYYKALTAAQTAAANGTVTEERKLLEAAQQKLILTMAGSRWADKIREGYKAANPSLADAIDVIGALKGDDGTLSTDAMFMYLGPEDQAQLRQELAIGAKLAKAGMDPLQAEREIGVIMSAPTLESVEQWSTIPLGGYFRVGKNIYRKTGQGDGDYEEID